MTDHIMLDFDYEVTVPEGTEEMSSRVAQKCLETEGVTLPCAAYLRFTDDNGIHEINRDQRGVDRATDVLSFPLYDFYAGETPLGDGCVELGDIVLSLERAKEQAAELGHSYEREAAFLCVHSVLHLLGYDHERSPEDEEIMCSRQREIMKKLKLTEGR